MSSFVRFVLTHRKDDSAWGDFAKDVAADRQVVRTWNWTRFEAYMQSHGASANAWGVMEEMNEAYKRMKNMKKKNV